jgi:hypothetical protein
MMPPNANRPPALTLAEQHNRYGVGRGECGPCCYLTLAFHGKHRFCADAVPEGLRGNAAYRWDPLWQACGVKKVGP